MDENNNSNSGETNPQVTSVYDYINNILMNPSIIIILVVVVLIYLALFMTLGGGSSSNSESTSDSSNSVASNAMMIVIIGVFVVLVIINGLQYFFGVDIIASIKNMFSGEPEVDISVDNSRFSGASPAPVPEIKLRKQVFNIPGNNYVYPDAKALCSAYGANLATYKQVEDAYNRGAEWCNYGWSEGQMALFPTQQSTYDGLQKIKGHENDCGRPGVNGGYMANPALRFGVNCYGYKPRMTPEEEELMQLTPHYPKTMNDIAMEQRVEYWKNKLTEILVSPFNYNNWSKI